MAKSYNKVILMGRLGKDAEVRHTGNGSAVVSFSLATDRYVGKDKEPETDWHNIVFWPRSEAVAKFLVKGTMLLVDGRLQTRKYEAKDGSMKYVTEVVCNDVTFAGGNKSGGGGSAVSEDVSTAAVGDEDVPF